MLLIAIFLLSCKTELKKIVETYPDGKPKTERLYNNKEDANSYHVFVYFENGKLQFESFVLHNKFIGQKRLFTRAEKSSELNT